MLNTIGALILAIQVTTSISNHAIITNAGFTKQTKAITYQQRTPVLKAIEDHYNNKGSWAGTFKIDGFIAHKIEKISQDKSIAHVKYRYVPIPNNAKGRTDSGIDQRTFTYIESDYGVKVITMGAFNSTKL